MAAKPINVSELTEAELDAELEKGYADMREGRIKPARQAFSDIRKDFSVSDMEIAELKKFLL